MKSSLLLLTTYMPLMLQGALTTLELWLLASGISLIFGVLTGALRSNPLRIQFVSQLLDYITVVLRGVPLYTQLILFYFALPDILGLSTSAFTAGYLVLGICSGAYTSEIVRGGINSIPQGQWAAAQALGYSRWAQLRYSIMPQVFSLTLPSLLNEYTMALKSTSIVASIGALELTKVGMNIIAHSLQPLTVCLSIGLIYLVITLLFSWLGQLLERKNYAYTQRY